MTADRKIAVAPENHDQLKKAADLAERVGLPLTTIVDLDFPILLVVTAHRLELRQVGEGVPGPVYVDFLAGKADYRRRYGSSRGEAVVRAVTSKRNRTPTVLDATGGLGRDAFVLAGHGCRVTMVERHPVIAALLEDGLVRAAEAEKIGRLVKEKMRLISGDSIKIMREMPEAGRPEMIYLDPMYPESPQSAQVKKEAQVLRLLAGPDLDSADLLAAALACARQRVVVKRPVAAPSLTGPKPELLQAAGAHRFDIYLIKPKH